MPGITDVHVHIEPYRSLKPEILETLWRTIPARDQASQLADDPRAFLAHLDSIGVERACLINYIAPEVMGFTEDVNRFVSEFAMPRASKRFAIVPVDSSAARMPFGTATSCFAVASRRDFWAAGSIGAATRKTGITPSAGPSPAARLPTSDKQGGVA